MNGSRRAFLIGGTALAASMMMLPGSAQVRPAVRASRVFRPEDFGARGDGITNDSAAFAALARAITENDGGEIALRGTTYLVGAQSPIADPAAAYSFEPAPLLDISGCAGPVIVRGNGARMKCASGLRYGVFAANGSPVQRPMPNMVRREIAAPYTYMVFIHDCTGPVLIENLELDGSLDAHLIGGQYLDTGWQIATAGIFLRDNRGDELVRNVHTHHHALDGLMIDGLDDAALAARVARRIENVRSEYNGRQGCSIVGGRGYAFRDCRFNHTGKGKIGTAPGAGVDIEAEGSKTVRDLSFVDCEFIDNAGCGLLAESGASEGATFVNCRFVGTTNWAAWPRKPGFRFRHCAFVGSIANCHGDAAPSRATAFERCTFVDDPAQTPNGEVYRAGSDSGTIADLSSAENILFDRCRFNLMHGAVLPWSVNAIYLDCSLIQSSGRIAYPRGTYRGANRIVGNVDLMSSRIMGALSINGRPYPG